MNKLATAKFAARILVGIGTTTVSNSIIRNNVSPSNIFEQITVGVASLVIGSMASEAAKSHTDRRIDEFAELFTSKTSTETTATA